MGLARIVGALALVAVVVGVVPVSARRQLQGGIRLYRRHNEKYPTGKQFRVDHLEKRVKWLDPIVARTLWLLPVGGIVFFITAAFIKN